MYGIGALKTSQEDISLLLKQKKISKFRIVRSNIPTSLSYRNQLNNVKDQGQTGACVAYSGASIMEYIQKKFNGTNYDFSPHFIYDQRNDLKVEGMYLINLIEILKNQGICYNDDYQIFKSATQNDIGIKEKILSKAKNWTVFDGIFKGNTIFSGEFISKDVTLIKSALVENGPCLVVLPVYNYTSTFWKKIGSQNLIGYHCVVIIGYDSNGFILRNSWGSKWNNDGHTLLSYSDFDSIIELWSIYPKSYYEKDEPEKIANNCLKNCKCVLL